MDIGAPGYHSTAIELPMYKVQNTNFKLRFNRFFYFTDYPRVIRHYIQQEDYEAALEVLKKEVTIILKFLYRM